MAIALPPPAAAETVVLKPTRDAWLDGHNPSHNNGAAAQLRVAGEGEGEKAIEQRAVLEFDLGAVTGTVKLATLSLQRIDGEGDDDVVAVYALAQAWEEGDLDGKDCADSGVTWDSRNCVEESAWKVAGGTTDGIVHAAAAIGGKHIGEVTWEVTGLVQSWIDGSLANHGMLLRRDLERGGGTQRHDFDSREGAVVPQLTIVYSPARPSSTTTFTATPTATATPSASRTATPTATFTPTTTGTATFTAIPTHTETPTAIHTATSTDTPTATETDTPTATETVTATETPTGTATGTLPSTATATPTPSPTETAVPSSTPTATVAALCAAAPVNGCQASDKGVLRLSRREDPTKSRLFWAWKARDVESADFGDPAETTTYSLCVYDVADSAPALKMSATVPPAGICLEAPCWKPLRKNDPSSLRLVDAERQWDGVSKIILNHSPSGRMKLLVYGSGAGLRLPVPVGDTLLAPGDSVVVQLQNSDRQCWENVFTPAPLTNRADLFKDKCGSGRAGGC